MSISLIPGRGLAFILAAMLAATPALAEKDHDGGKGHKGKGDKHSEKAERKADKQEDKWEKKAEKREDKAEKREYKAEKQARKDDHDRNRPRVGGYFDDRHRQSVNTYYTSYSGKSCPPGLAKKNNGCMPPGQAKKWHVGQPLPSNVTVYSVPQPILVTLPPAPPQYRYVRVASDILLIAAGSRMVVDGINGLIR